MKTEDTRLKAINAYGGEAFWREAKYIEATIDAKGLAFLLKQRPTLQEANILIDIHRPYSEITPIGSNKDISGVLEDGNVYLKDQNGSVLKERKNAREAFGKLRRWLWWDDLDMAYFGNYAMWNYLTLPVLLLREDIEWTQTQPGILKAIFPDSIPTHSREQEFQFDLQTGLLKLHNYTPDIIARAAKAANRVVEHKRSSDGIIYASERIVTPQSLSGQTMEFPKIIELSIRNFKVH